MHPFTKEVVELDSLHQYNDGTTLQLFKRYLAAESQEKLGSFVEEEWSFVQDLVCSCERRTSWLARCNRGVWMIQ